MPTETENTNNDCPWFVKLDKWENEDDEEEE